MHPLKARRRFRFIKELASGGFGKVYLAEVTTAEGFSSVVAIKVLHGKWSAHTEIVKRARDEARLLGRLRHRNIVRVEDLTSIQGQAAIVMEYLEGVDFKTLVNHLVKRGDRVALRTAFEAVGAVAGALWAAWEQVPLQGGEPLRLIHRDVKPSNIMLTVEGDVKLLDFGTARGNFENREAHTQALAFGSQAYMPPERMMGEPDTPAGDVFSLGVTAFEVLAGGAFGKLYLREERYEQALDERLGSLNLGELDPELARRVTGTLRAMLAYEPTHRPSAQQVVEIMEILADESRDAGPRRFARTWVKSAMEELKHTPEGPTLEGQSLAEDRATGSFSPSSAPALGDAPPTSFAEEAPDPLTPMIPPPPPLEEARTYYPGDDEPPLVAGAELPVGPPLAAPPREGRPSGRPVTLPPLDQLPRDPVGRDLDKVETVLDPEAARRAFEPQEQAATQRLDPPPPLAPPSLDDPDATRQRPGWRPAPPTAALPPPPNSAPRVSKPPTVAPAVSLPSVPSGELQPVDEGLLGPTERMPVTPLAGDPPPPPPSLPGKDEATLPRQEFQAAEAAEPARATSPEPPSADLRPTPSGSGGGAGRMLAVLAAAFLLTVIVAGGLGFWWVQQQKQAPVQTPPTTDVAGTETPTTPDPPPEVDLSAAPAKGTGHLKLELPASGAGTLTLSGMGYKQEVPGQALVALADVPKGTLRTKLRGGDNSHRGTLDVEEGKTCTWKLPDLDSEWQRVGCD
ncbi:MAG: serine/threonine-protein kinase [Myxococcota bacterium]|nr:serine/threonine-protein kinase [Myxococcota bacterium]